MDASHLPSGDLLLPVGGVRWACVSWRAFASGTRPSGHSGSISSSAGGSSSPAAARGTSRANIRPRSRRNGMGAASGFLRGRVALVVADVAEPRLAEHPVDQLEQGRVVLLQLLARVDVVVDALAGRGVA